MHVPETTMNLDDFLAAYKHDIWFPRQVLPVQAIPEAHLVDYGTNNQFRSSILALDSRHIAAALLASVYISHFIEF
jgi:hypothetical protein